MRSSIISRTLIDVSLFAKLQRILDSSDGERKIAGFLRKNPELVLWPFYKGSHCNYVLHEFPLGIRYKADFVVLSAYSGMWEATFVELEPVSERIITRAGTPTRRIAGAISQLGDWQDQVDRNRPTLHQDLAHWCKKRDLLGWSGRDEPCNYTCDYLKDPSIAIRFHYAIVAGRRASMTPEGWRKLNQHRIHWETRIRTYDMFLDIAKNIDARDARKSVEMTTTAEHWVFNVPE